MVGLEEPRTINPARLGGLFTRLILERLGRIKVSNLNHEGNKMAEFHKYPMAESCRRIDFEKVEIFPGPLKGSWILVVSGTKPYINMKVELMPLIYIQQPEYWGIEVVGCLPGVGLPATGPYSVSLPLDGITGTLGIEVMGATRAEKRKIPPP